MHPGILYRCYAAYSREGEQFIYDHVLSYTIDGASDLYDGNRMETFGPGSIKLFRRNRLAKFYKRPPEEGEYRSITIVFDQEMLRAFSMEYGYTAERTDNNSISIRLEPTPMLQHYMDSLQPYTRMAEPPTALTQLKVKEALLILMQDYPYLKDILFDFSEPGKVDLEGFMNGHFQFNVPMERFAYLSGRSLATFKRDFEKIFHTSPSRWLQQKRLQEAWYRIKEKGHKPSDVYLDVGFEDLSHFSFAFKKAYGVAPSRV